ncbi:MAG: glycosyltransferase family protein [Magnetococcales bacterium]|nr:glycosyltransferase family protein [Magnetococcales bacterium]
MNGDVRQARERAFALHAAGDPVASLAVVNVLLACDRSDPYLLNLAATCLRESGDPAGAEAMWVEALRIHPGLAGVWINLGNLWAEAGAFREAEDALREALRLAPKLADAWFNLAILLVETRRPDEAESAYRRVLELQPDHADAVYNLSLLLLSHGRFQEGWPLHEARHHPAKSARQSHPIAAAFPMWRGEDLTGRSLLVVPEQGFGDQIQFCRYLPELKARGVARLTCAVHPWLRELFATLDGVDAVVEAGGDYPEHDYWTFPLSIPRHLGGAIPARLPYLRVPEGRSARLGALENHIRVGLVWKGSPTNRNDSNRSIPSLRVLSPLWAVSGISWFSLCKQGEREELPAGQPLTDLSGTLRDFADTAAIIAGLDLVIAVDTAVVHLAGALQRPCWVMLSALGTDWRWMHERDDSPWYPGCVRLFRQTRPGDWSDVVVRVADALRCLVRVAEH